MSLQPLQKPQTLARVSVGLLLVSLTAPCALHNRIIAACSLGLALLSIGGIVYCGYRALHDNRKALEREILDLTQRNRAQGKEK